MSRALSIRGVRSRIATWLLAIFVVLGPTGLVSSAPADADCGVDCPCEQVLHEGHQVTDAGAGSVPSPCEKPCDEGCSDCGCCPVFAVAPPPAAGVWVGPLAAASPAIPPFASPARVAPLDVFRPPRRSA